MKHELILLSILLVVLGVGCPAPKTINEEIYDSINKYIAKNEYAPGISVAVYGNGVDCSYASGYMSLDTKQRNTESTPHILYSISKSFTASEILKLAGEGKLSLDDTIEDLIPEIVTESRRLYVNSDATIKEMLTHRSGMSDYTGSTNIFLKYPFKDSWDPERILDFIEATSASRDAQTGEYPFVYSSTNYIILSLIIEKVTGEKLSSLMASDFTTPLGLSLKLLPEDEYDYGSIAHPHVYPNTYMSIQGDGKTPVDLTTIVSDAIPMTANFSFGAGGAVGGARVNPSL